MVVPLSTKIMLILTWNAGEWSSAEVRVRLNYNIFEHRLDSELARHFGVGRVLDVANHDHQTLNGDGARIEGESTIRDCARNFD